MLMPDACVSPTIGVPPRRGARHFHKKSYFFIQEEFNPTETPVLWTFVDVEVPGTARRAGGFLAGFQRVFRSRSGSKVRASDTSRTAASAEQKRP